MKLRYSTTSPFVRKVTVSAIETGLDSRIARIPTLPTDPSSGLSDDNPLGKVPALITDDGERLYDSPVICEYLDSLHGGAKLFPPAGKERWTALRRQALADGILDAGVLRMMETRRPPNLQSQEWIARQKGKIDKALDRLDAEAGALGDPAGPADIGRITVGIALGYVDFRFPDEGWRKTRPSLAAWYEQFAKRPSMLATIPKDPA